MSKKIFFILLVFALGGVIGFYFTSYSCKCLEINATKDVFYGKLASNLQKEMQARGYKFGCPKIFPKTVLDFYYTNFSIHKQKRKLRKQDINMALIGGCSMGFDIELLKRYDLILPVVRNRISHFSKHNLQAIHFPITNGEYSYFCNVDYYKSNIDIKKLGQQFEDIIRRARR